jgi:hypothetical protein
MVGNLDHLAYDYDYFVEAIKVATKMFPDASFFFFSEEPSYIEQEILPRLNPNIEVEVAKNDANKCYMDLLLLAACKHVIASQGAMGPMAFILNKHPDKKLIVPTRFKSWVADLKLDVIIPW